MANVSDYVNGKINNLTKQTQTAVKNQLNKIGKDTVDKLKEYTKKYWYSNYTPSDYQRTYSFLNTIRYRIFPSIPRVAIFYDFRLLDHAVNKDGWGTHVGFDGKQFNEGLVQFIENGTFYSGNKGASPRAGKGGSGAIEKTEKWLEEYLDKEVKRRLELTIGARLRRR